MRQEKRKLDRARRLEVLTLFILFVFILFVIINTFVISLVNVDGSSMSPTFENGDRLVFSKFSISSKSLDRGRVVLFEGKDHRRYIKRIVGLPGEMVEIKDGKVFVNGSQLKDDLNLGDTYRYNVNKWYLKLDQFFVLGDNRSQNDSKDSRIFGPIDLKDIEGKFLFEL